MKKFLQSEIVTLGLAIFSMLFGAGNLMYPLAVGMFSGTQNGIGISAFMISAIFLPLIGIITMILYKGDYESFFARLGQRSGSLMIFICMLVLGPIIAMPRIITLSHTMMTPFIPCSFLTTPSAAASFVFAIIFLGVTFLFTYRENKIVDILGLIVSPILVSSLAYIIIKGVIYAQQPAEQLHAATATSIFFNSLIRGYETLDLIGALFFSSIILNIMRADKKHKIESEQEYAFIGLQGGLIGTSLLGIIYIGMSLLGVYYGQGLENSNPGELFREISLRILGGYGTLIVAVAVLLACLSTAIALAAVIAEYVKNKIFHHRISYAQALLLTIIACIPLATAGLNRVLELTAGPLTFVGYPMLITLTLCNLAYKLWGFKPVRIPVLLTFFLSLGIYCYL